MPISSPTDHPTERDCRAGFTLMEVVLAMTIIGMLAALGLPYIRPHTGVSALRAKTHEIVALMRMERNSALRTGSPSAVLVDIDRRLVESAGSRAQVSIPEGMSMRVMPDGQRGVQFFADGRSSGMQLSLTSGDKTLIIDVNAVSAAVDTRSVAR